MQIKTEINYNMDILCFINIMTADQYYISFHKDEFDKFYPMISDNTKQNINDFIEKRGYSMLSPTLTLFISSMTNFADRNLLEMLEKHTEITDSMNKTPYIFSGDDFSFYFSFFDIVLIPLINELETAGFNDFWIKNKLPQIKAKCEGVDKYMEQYNVHSLINQYKNIDDSDFTVYMCSFAKPHGIKLCGNNIISDISYTDENILSNITHEAFHPAFDWEKVKQSLKILSDKPWVKEAFINQNPNSGYNTMDGFIEEHIVEALGIYVMVQLETNIKPMEYFKSHDEGSHVISPYFYEYLCETKKESSQSFEDYFNNFVDTLKE
jgi:hypothetical protein